MNKRSTFLPGLLLTTTLIATPFAQAQAAQEALCSTQAQSVAKEFLDDLLNIVDSEVTKQSSLVATDLARADLQINQEAQSFLHRRGERPLNCPLRSTGHRDLLDKLKTLSQGLQNSKCSTVNKEAVESMKTVISDIDSYMSGKTSEEIIANSALSEAQQTELKDLLGTGSTTVTKSGSYTYSGYVTRAQDLMTILSNVASDDACAYDMKERGFVPVVADIIQNFSQMGLLIPSVYGVAGAATGATVGSSLQIVHNLLKSRFDWTKESERQNFSDLVCTFYDLRVLLHDRDLIRLPTGNDASELAKAEEFSAKIKMAIEDLGKKKAAHSDLIAKKLKDYIAFNTHPSHPAAMDAVAELRAVLEKASTSASTYPSAIFRRDLAKALSKLHALKGSFDIDRLHNPLLNFREIDDHLFNENLKNLSAKDDAKIIEYFKHPAQNLFELLEDERTEHTNAWKALKKDGQLSNAEQIAAMEKQFGEDLAALTKTQSELSTKIERLKGLLKQDQSLFASTDDGSMNHNSILTEYNNIQNSLYGKTGWSFLKYAITEGRAHSLNFSDGFVRFNRDFLSRVATPTTTAAPAAPAVAATPAKPTPTGIMDMIVKGIAHLDGTYQSLRTRPSQKIVKPITPIELNTACANAKDLLKSYLLARSMSDIATDYLNSNRDLFNSNTKNHDTFFFIPISESAQKKLIRELGRYIKVDTDLKNNKKLTMPTENRLTRIFQKQTVGDTMKRVVLQKEKAMVIQDFYVDNDCWNYGQKAK